MICYGEVAFRWTDHHAAKQGSFSTLQLSPSKLSNRSWHFQWLPTINVTKMMHLQSLNVQISLLLIYTVVLPFKIVPALSQATIPNRGADEVFTTFFSSLWMKATKGPFGTARPSYSVCLAYLAPKKVTNACHPWQDNCSYLSSAFLL